MVVVDWACRSIVARASSRSPCEASRMVIGLGEGGEGGIRVLEAEDYCNGMIEDCVLLKRSIEKEAASLATMRCLEYCIRLGFEIV